LIATPFSLSGVEVGTARNSLTLSPRNPGNVVQPNWYIIVSVLASLAGLKTGHYTPCSNNRKASGLKA
jgi:hypothetical protein